MIQNSNHVKNVRQEWSDDNEKIYSITVFNEFSGQDYKTFELWQYPKDTNNKEVVELLKVNNLNESALYKAISLLGTQIATHPDFNVIKKKVIGE